MNLRLVHLLFGILLLATAFSCQNNSGGVSKNITGRPGELVVVVRNDAWEGNVGSLIRKTLAQEHVALPQDEPLFDLIQVPREAFTSIFRTTRNIVQVSITSNLDSTGVIFQQNVYAKPQSVVTINARDENEFIQLFDEQKDRIISYFLRAERDRLTSNYLTYYEKSVRNILNDAFGLTMHVGPGFQVALQNEDFIWMKYETPEISQGIIIYTFPYQSDSAFTEAYQVAVRDSFLKANVPGPTEGSYMATEKRIEQVYNVRRHNGNYATEMRGLWRLMNDFMGGPYISLAQLDLENQRVVVAYGYVYAPSKDKRNLLRQVEAMLYTLKLNNQANNDILNRQYDVAGIVQ